MNHKTFAVYGADLEELMLACSALGLDITNIGPSWTLSSQYV